MDLMLFNVLDVTEKRNEERGTITGKRKKEKWDQNLN